VLTPGKTGDIRAIWGTAANDVWAVTADGKVLHMDGMAWSVVAEALTGGWSGVWAHSPREVWVAGNAGVGRFDGTTWRTLNPPFGTVQALWGAGPGAPWGAGEFGFGNSDLVFWNGRLWDWGQYAEPPPFESRIKAIWGTRPDNVWAVGTRSIYRYDGKVWRAVFTPDRRRGGLLAVRGLGETDVWAVGDFVVNHFDGRRWTDVAPDPGIAFNTFYGVWASAADDVWIVGANGYILHIEGDFGERVPSGTRNHLYGIWGSSPTDIWAVGQGGVILHYGLHEPAPPAPGPDCKQEGQACATGECCGSLQCMRFGGDTPVCR
jgi:hypothetical protein